MKVKEDMELRAALLSDLKNKFARRGEIHLTHLIYCPRKAYYDLTAPQHYDDEQILRYSLGLAWQDRLTLPNPNRSFHVNGIWFTPDGYVESEEGIIPIEAKLTGAKTKPPEEMPHMLEQLKGYCALLGSKHGILVVLHVRGNYRDRKIELKTYRVEFDEEELERTVEELVRRKEELERCLRENELPPASPQYDWECTNCYYAELCRATEKIKNHEGER